ncbi:helix-turn-helix domain-containing protein [Niallia sp. RD1]|uniref:helix-turn-helix domain-containing protein n=1 Tax=Niallia TaxID=2837506 RepID=UPI0020C19DBD|nr:helix-turn-helix transcriptional regulator [Niallia sp. RD1]UTI40229.1 helix-turn-helix domain-containing protein [Niallia sp. RD1]
MLGERIRTLRKQRKMTLEALAGERLTKGMLSQIENNKAKPSMESLEYIAERLNVTVSELVDKFSSTEIRKVLNQAEKLHKGFQVYFRNKKETIETCKKIMKLIQPYINSMNDSYESARLLEIYSHSLFCLYDSQWEIYFKKAATIYDTLNLTANRAEVGIFKAITIFLEHRYKEALQTFLEERHLLETSHYKIDSMTKVNLDYHEAAFYSAIGDSQGTAQAIERALDNSKKEKIYYKTDDIYKLAAFEALLGSEDQKFNYYLKKLKQFGEFLEDENYIELYDVLYVEYLINIKGQYSRVMPIIDKYVKYDEKELKLIGDNWNILQKGKALYYIQAYEKSLEILLTVHVPDYLNHPVDFGIYYIKDTYIALCYKELNNQKDAFHYAKIAYDNFLPLPNSIFRKLSIETYESISSN